MQTVCPDLFRFSATISGQIKGIMPNKLDPGEIAAARFMSLYSGKSISWQALLRFVTPFEIVISPW